MGTGWIFNRQKAQYNIDTKYHAMIFIYEEEDIGEPTSDL
jgi:hypothetical protein